MRITACIGVLFIVMVQSACSGTSEKEPEYNEMSTSKKISFRENLKTVGTSFTEIEEAPLLLQGQTIPADLQKYHGETLRNTRLTYLKENEAGSVISCSLEYETFARLFVATLDKERNLSDYRVFGNGHLDIQATDTISQLVFGKDDEIIVEELHMSMDDEPEFEVDGIRRSEFAITKNLQLQEK